MEALFTNREKGILIEVDLRNGFKERLTNWLETEHEDIFWDIELHEGGNVTVDFCDTPKIVFTGDNGIFSLELVNIVQV